MIIIIMKIFTKKRHQMKDNKTNKTPRNYPWRFYFQILAKIYVLHS